MFHWEGKKELKPSIFVRLHWLDLGGGMVKAREYPDTIAHYVSFRVWSVFFQPVQSCKARRFAQLYPEVRVQYSQHPCEELDQRYDHDI